MSAAVAGSEPQGLGWGLVGMPSNRQYANAQMVYDAADGYVVLFGGQNWTQARDADTWTYAHGVWTQLHPPVSPKGRDTASMTYDGMDGYVLLFGGFTGSIGDLGDTWAFRGGSWTQLTPSLAPSPRYGAAMAYDPARGQVVLFGGSSNACPNAACNDTWAFWFGYWFQVATAHAPTQRYRTEMVYDAADGYLLLFGGNGVGCFSGYCGDTWKFTGSDWVQIATGGSLCGTAAEGKCAPAVAPGERQMASLVYDPADNTTLLFGGINGTAIPGDTWSFNAGNWTHLSPSTTPPSRWGAPIAFDALSGDDYVVMFGGGYGYGVPIDQVWTFHAGAWSQIAPTQGPPWEWQASMAYDPIDGYVVLFGGIIYGDGYSQSTWIYRSGTWTELVTPLAPLNRYGAAMTWDATDGFVMLYGGYSYAGYVNDTWSFLNGQWKELCTYGASGSCVSTGSRPPPARLEAGLANLPNWGYTVLFGGLDASGHVRNDTWIWWQGGWYNFTWLTQPVARDYVQMVYDPQVGGIVMFGGDNGSAALGDTWELTNPFGAWTQVGACGAPSQASCPGNVPAPRYGHSLVYDSVQQSVEVYGGAGGCCYNGQPVFAFHAGSWNLTCIVYWCYPFAGGTTPYYRWGGAMAFDAADGYAVYQGGFTPGAPGVARDTWAFGPNLIAQSPVVSSDFLDLGQSLTLSAGAAGGGNGVFTYQWAGLPTGCVPPDNVSTVTCTVGRPGQTYAFGYNWAPTSFYPVNVVVTDSNGFPGGSSGDTLIWVAHDPTLSLESSAAVRDAGETVWFNASVTGGWYPYTFAWSGLPPCSNAPGTGNSIRCNLTASSMGSWTVSVEMTDGANYSVASLPVALTVNPDPNATGVSVSRTALDAGQVLSLGVTVTGGSGTYTYNWTNIPAACEADAPLLTCTVPAAQTGTYTDPTVTITDTNGVSTVDTYSGAIVVSPAPTASSLGATNGAGEPATSADAGQTLTFALTDTSGSGGDTVVWSGLPAGCAASGSDSLSVACTPSGAGTFEVGATVTDSNGRSATSPSLTVVISPALGGVAVSATRATLDVGQSVSIGALVSGGSGVYTYAWSGLPAGCAATSGTLVACSPAAPGAYTVALNVTDSNGASKVATTSITVNAVLAVTVSNTVTSANAPSSITFTATVSGGTTPTSYVWLLNGSVVSGASSSTLTLSGVAAGTYDVQVLVADGAGVTVSSATATVVVAPAPPATPFASAAEYSLMAMLAVLIALAVGILLVVRSARTRPPKGPEPGTSTDELDAPPPK